MAEPREQLVFEDRVTWTDDNQDVTCSVGLDNGARVLLKIVATSPPGGDDMKKPERIVEGDAAPEVVRVGPPRSRAEGSPPAT